MDCDGTLIIDILAKVLSKLISINERECKSQMAVTIPVKFTSSCVPEMSIWDYLERIKKYSSCSDSCFIVALIYIDRAIELKNLVLSHLNVHRILITSILIAVKFLDDSYMNNAFYAKIGGITTTEMNTLELDFLLFLGFSLQVSSDLYSAYHSELRGYVSSNRFLPFYDEKSYSFTDTSSHIISSSTSDNESVDNVSNKSIIQDFHASPYSFPFFSANQCNYSEKCFLVSPSILLETSFKDQAKFLISYSGHSVQF